MNGITNAGSAGGGEGRVTLLYESGRLDVSESTGYDLPDSAWLVIAWDVYGQSVVMVGGEGGGQTSAIYANWTKYREMNKVVLAPVNSAAGCYYKVYGLT